MDRVLFVIECTTCQVKLNVRHEAAIGAILTCPKCGSMVHVVPPANWRGISPGKPDTEQSQAGSPSGTAERPTSSSGLAAPSSPPSEGAQPRTVTLGDRDRKALSSRGTSGGMPVAKSTVGPEEATSNTPGTRAAAESQTSPESLGAQTSPAVPRETVKGSAAAAQILSALGTSESSLVPSREQKTPQGTLARASTTTSVTGDPLEPPRISWALWIANRWVLGVALAGSAAMLALGMFIGGLVWRSGVKVAGGDSATVPPLAAQGNELRIADIDGSSTPQPLASFAPDVGWWRRWIPRESRAFGRLDTRSASAAHAFSFFSWVLGPGFDSTVVQGLGSLGIRPEAIGEIVWALGDLSLWPDPGIIAVCLTARHETRGLSLRGDFSDLSIGAFRFRVDATSGWPYPFGILDIRTFVTGREALLRSLGDNRQPMTEFASPAIQKLWPLIPSSADCFVVIDLGAMKTPPFRPLDAVFEVWPEAKEVWKLVSMATVGILALYRSEADGRMDLALLCETPTTAQQLREALSRFTSTISGAEVSQEGKSDGNSAPLGTGDGSDEHGEVENPLRSVVRNYLQNITCEVEGEIVWLRLKLVTDLASTLAKLSGARAELLGAWQSAGATIAEENQRCLLRGLEDYRSAWGILPPGAGGAPLLPPETRLSWIAMLLPHLGLADWHRQLRFAYSWNTLPNRDVALRPLSVVDNPLIDTKVAAGGFPCSHYVGVGGVGPEAPYRTPGSPQAGLFSYRQPVRLEDIPDGASNTLAVLGVYADLGPWAAGGRATVRPLTKPPYVNGPDGFGSGMPHGMLAGMADGSVRFISRDVDPRVLEQMAAIGDGLPLDLAAVESVGPRLHSSPSPRVVANNDSRGEQRAFDSKTPAFGAGPGERDMNPMDTPLGGAEQTQGIAVASGSRNLRATATRDEQQTVVRSTGGAGPSRNELLPPPLAETSGEPTSIKRSDTTDAESDSVLLPQPDERLAMRFTQAKIPSIPLVDAVRLAGRMANVPVAFDLDALVAFDHDLLQPVSVDLAGGTLGELLEGILKPRGLTYALAHGCVVVTLPESRRNELVTIVYPLKGLTSSDSKDIDRLATFIRMFIAPESWQEHGSAGTLTIQGEEVVVLQTGLVQRQVAKFLDRLRVARSLGGLSLGPQGPDQLATQLGRAKPALLKPVTVNFFEPTSLSSVMEFIERQTDVKLVIDYPACTTEGISPSTLLTIAAYEEPLAVVLEQMLFPLGLGYRALGPRLLEISPRKILDKRLEFEFYRVKRLLALLEKTAEGQSPEEVLLEKIKADLGGGLWSDAGGSGEIALDRPSQCLIVLQSQVIHAELERLLLRSHNELEETSP